MLTAIESDNVIHDIMVGFSDPITKLLQGQDFVFRLNICFPTHDAANIEKQKEKDKFLLTNWLSFEKNNGGACEQWCVEDIRMTYYPANVRSAKHNFFSPDSKQVTNREV